MSKGAVPIGKHLVVIGIFLAALVLWLGYILSESGTLPTLGDKYEVKAIVPSASLLTPGARVTVAGAEVGSLKKIERASDVGPGAKLTLELTEKEVYPLPDDTKVEIRTRSQVGENYVALVIGNSKQTFDDGDTMPIENAEELVDVDQVLSIFRGKTKERTRRLFEDFGYVLTGSGEDLNQTVRGLNEFAEYGGTTVKILHRDKKNVARLVDNLGRVTAAFGERGAAIDTIANRGSLALNAIGDRDQQLAETLRELPATLFALGQTTQTVGNVSDSAAPVISRLATTTKNLEPVLRDLVPAAQDGRSLLNNLGDNGSGLGNGFLVGASSLGSEWGREGPVVKMLREVSDSFCQLNPGLKYLRPRIADTWSIVTHLGSGANAYDATGHTVVLTPTLNEGSAAYQPKPVLDAFKVLLQSGTFGTSRLTGYDPYPAIGSLGHGSISHKGDPLNAQELKASGFKYPRVQPKKTKTCN